MKLLIQKNWDEKCDLQLFLQQTKSSSTLRNQEALFLNQSFLYFNISCVSTMDFQKPVSLFFILETMVCCNF